MSDDRSLSKVNNIVNIKYNYIPNEDKPDIVEKECETSNIVNLGINPKYNASLLIKKLSDNDTVSPGDIINYTMLITNNGNVDLTAIQIKDKIDLNASYIDGSAQLTVVGSSIDKQILEEFENKEEASKDDIFDDYVRAKLAVFIRDDNLSAIDAIKNIEGVTIPDGIEQALNKNFVTQNPAIDFLDIEEVNAGYGTGTGQGNIRTAVVDLYNYVAGNANIDDEVAVVNHFDATDVMRYTPFLISGTWGEEGKSATPDLISAIKNVIQVIKTTVNKLYELRVKTGVPEERRDIMDENINSLKEVLENYFYIYTNEPVTEYYNADGTIKDLTLKSDITNENVDKDLLLSKIQVLKEQIDDCLPEVRYCEIPEIYFYVKFITFVSLGMANVISKIPEYINGNYNNPNVSRLTKILDVAKDGIAIVDTIIPYLTASVNKGRYVNYITSLKKERDLLESTRQNIAIHTQDQILDPDAATVASAANNILKIINDLSEAVVSPDEDPGNLPVYPIKFIPVTSNPEAMETETPGNEGKNPDSPEESADDVTVLEAAKKIVDDSSKTTSYIVVPQSARESCPESTAETDRIITVHLNDLLKSGESALIKISVKTNGENDDENGYSINNLCNVKAYNAENITNKVGAGYTALSDGEEIPELHTDPPADLDNPTEEEKTRMDEIQTDVKFAKIIASKDVFKFVDNEYVPIDEDGISCGDKICYLITLKNYGNVAANNVEVKDLLKTGLDFTDYNPTYIGELDDNIVKENMPCFTIKVYDPNNPDDNQEIASYVTGENNRLGEVYLSGYPCVSDNVAKKVIKLEDETDQNSAYGILVKNKYISVMNATVPARLADGNIEVEDYDKTLPQSDTSNDDEVGILEFRIYYTVSCFDD